MDNFGFIEYQPLSCKLATYAKNMLHISRGGASAPPPLPMPAGAHDADAIGPGPTTT